MSLFGKLDAANIPTNSFFVAAGDYSATITDGEYRQGRNGRQLHIEYQITDPESEYLDSKVGQYFDLVDADMTEEAFELLPAEDKKKIRKTNSAIKRTLCGNEGRDDQPGLGVTEDELNDPDWNPKSLVGTEVDLTIYNFGAKNEGVGVRYVNKQV